MRKDQIFLLACLGYIGGVFAGSFFVVVWWVIFLLFAVWIALVSAFSRKHIFLLAFPLVLFSFGVFSVADSSEKFREENMNAKEVSGVARVVNDPEERSFYRQTILRMEVCDNEYCPQEKILWQAPLEVRQGNHFSADSDNELLTGQAPRTSAIVPGARIAFACAFTLPENFDAAFDYRMFLAKDDIGYVCRRATHAEPVTEDAYGRFMRVLFAPKHAFERALERSLPQPEAGLAAGLLLGGDNRLPETLKEIFVKAGLSHIVAISGYNIALIAQGFVILGIVIGLWRRQSLWFSALGIILFIVLVGAPTSAVRAGIMGLSAFAALFAGRLSRSANVLLFAAVLMLLFQPLLLRYDVGFQLSFLATLAIIIALPLMERWLPKEFFGKSFVEIALLTFSVELFVVPLLVYQFQNLSPFALIANVLLLPLVPYAMFASFAGGIAFFIFPGLHMLPVAVAYFFLRVITFVAEQISVWPGAAVEVAIGGGTLLVWYAGLFFAIVMMRNYSYGRKYVRTENIS